MTAPPCTDCGLKPAYTRGVCKACYSARRRNGTRDQLPTPKRQPGRCDRGHDMTGENARLRADGQRACIACANDRNRAYRESRRTGRPPRMPKPEPAAKTPRTPKAPKPPKSKLPPGWDKPLAKPRAAVIKGTEKEIPLVQPTPAAMMHAALDTLAAHDALDLAPMLGLEVAA